MNLFLSWLPLATCKRSIYFSFLLFGTLVCAGFGQEAEPSAVQVLDVSQNEFNHSVWLDCTRSVAQTFRPTVSGQLSQVEIPLSFQNGYQAYPLTLEIVETVTDTPSGRVLGRAMITNFTSQQWPVYNVDFQRASIYLRTNELYALVLKSDAPPGSATTAASAWTGNPYGGGTLWEKQRTNAWNWIADYENPPAPDSDLTFRTYMVPGLPAVRISSPLDGRRLRAGDQLTVTAEVGMNAPDQSVELYHNEILLGTVTEHPFSVKWENLPVGNHGLTAVLKEAGSVIATSAVVHVTVAGATPGNDDFANRWLLSGTYVSGAGSNLQATLEPGEALATTNTIGASIWWSWVATGTGPVYVTSRKSAGTNVVLAVYRGSWVDNLLLVASSAQEVVFNAEAGVAYQIGVDTVGTALEKIEVELAASDFALTSPAAHAVFVAPANINAAITNFGTRTIQRVEYFEDTVRVGASSNSPFSLTYTSVVPGKHLLTARAIDTTGMASCAAPVSITVRPRNDDFAGAISLEGYFDTEEASTVAATMQRGELRWFSNRGGHSIWYVWTAPETGTCTLSGTGPGLGLLFTVYTGPALGQLTSVGNNVFASSGVPVSFHAVAGTTYRIAVDGFEGEQGAVSFTLQLTPANDTFAKAKIILGESFHEMVSNRGATQEQGEPVHAGVPGGHSIWWTWTAPASAVTEFSCVSANPPTMLAVYTGHTVGTLSRIASSVGTNAGVTTVSFTAQKGVTYALVVDEASTAGGDIDVRLSMALLRITSPLAGAAIRHPATIQLSAVEPDVAAELARVDFLVNQTLLASVTNRPFTYWWTNAPAGAYSLVARGTRPDGQVRSSLPLTFLVYTNNELPVPRIAAGYISSYAISAVGHLYVWGWNSLNHYGLTTGPLDPICPFPEDPDSCDPATGEALRIPQIAVNPPGVTQWKQVASRLGGDLGWAVGNNGQLYRNGRELLPMPEGVGAWTSIEYGFAIADNGQYFYDGVLCHPQGTMEWVTIADDYHLAKNGQLFIRGVADFQPVPFPAGVSRWKAIAKGLAHCLALTENGQLYAWGFNYSGQLGLGDKVDRSAPVLVPLPTGVAYWTAVAAGGHHSLAIANNGALYAWGRNWENQLGIGYIVDQPGTPGPTNSTIIETSARPLQVSQPAGVTAWTAIAAGFSHSLAIGNDCQLYAWGDNGYGQVGTGIDLSLPYPAKVIGLGPLCGIPVINSNSRNSRLPDGSFQIEFRSDMNRLYYVQYSSDAQNWKTAYPAVLGTGETILWIDDGPPRTDSLPSGESTRFYRVISGE